MGTTFCGSKTYRLGSFRKDVPGRTARTMSGSHSAPQRAPRPTHRDRRSSPCRGPRHDSVASRRISPSSSDPKLRRTVATVGVMKTFAVRPSQSTSLSQPYSIASSVAPPATSPLAQVRMSSPSPAGEISTSASGYRPKRFRIRLGMVTWPRPETRMSGPSPLRVGSIIPLTGCDERGLRGCCCRSNWHLGRDQTTRTAAGCSPRTARPAVLGEARRLDALVAVHEAIRVDAQGSRYTVAGWAWWVRAETCLPQPR